MLCHRLLFGPSLCLLMLLPPLCGSFSQALPPIFKVFSFRRWQGQAELCERRSHPQTTVASVQMYVCLVDAEYDIQLANNGGGGGAERSGEKPKQDGGISSRACISCRGYRDESITFRGYREESISCRGHRDKRISCRAQGRKHIMQGAQRLSCRGLRDKRRMVSIFCKVP